MKALNYPSLNAKQKQLLKDEAKRQARKYYEEQTELCSKILDNALLLSLRYEFGFGEKRLKRAYFAFFKMHKQLSEMYDAEKNEDLYSIYENQLHNLGFDPKAWEAELTKELEAIDG